MSVTSVNCEISAELHLLVPGERVVKTKMFEENFDAIEETLARGATKTAVLRALAKGGLSLSINTFNKMLKAERKRRATSHDNHETPVGSALKTMSSQSTGDHP
jgi:hypothetical protein